MKKFFLLIILVCFSVSDFAQTNEINQERLKQYWYMRWRLKNYFMVVGEGPGMSLPAEVRNEYNGGVILDFGDSPNNLGPYIGVLATEYKLLNDNSQNTDETLLELYYAIKAINRLDECEAQYPWNESANILDGLCSRGDAGIDPNAPNVPTNFVQLHYTELNKNLGNFKSTSNQQEPDNSGDPQKVTSGSSFSGNSDKDKAEGIMSQDHISSIFVGLALVKKFIPAGTIVNGMDLNDEATQITKRIIHYMQSNDWTLKGPGGYTLSAGFGSQAWAYSYGFAKAAAFICPGNFTDFLDDEPITYKPLWDALAIGLSVGSWGVGGYSDVCSFLVGNGVVDNCPSGSIPRNTWIALNLAAVGSSWETVALDVSLVTNIALAPLAAACFLPGIECTQGFIWAASEGFAWEAYYPLLHATLHNSACITDRSRIEYDLNSYPCSGNWHFDNNVSSGWATQRKYHDSQYENNYGEFNGSTGIYSGLEFMLLNNLYYIHGENKDSKDNPLPQYTNRMDITPDKDFPFPVFTSPPTPVLVAFVGSQTTPITVGAFNTITANNKITADASGDPNKLGDVSYRAGEKIVLGPGFEVQSGAFFEAFIDPFECLGNAYFRHADTTAADAQHHHHNNNDSTLYGMHNPPFVKNNYVPIEPTKQPVAQPLTKETKSPITNLQSAITLVPNPSASGVFQLQVASSEKQITNVVVYNLLGETVYKSAIASQQYAIDISSYSRGVYFVKVQTGEKLFVQKVIYQ